jgi:hypothetical protein
MKEGLNDKTLKKMLEMNKKISNRITLSLRSTKPFASNPVPPEDLIYAKRTLGYNDLMALYQEYGREEVDKLMHKIQKMEDRRIKRGTIKEEEGRAIIPEQATDSLEQEAFMGGQDSGSFEGFAGMV